MPRRRACVRSCPRRRARSASTTKRNATRMRCCATGQRCSRRSSSSSAVRTSSSIAWSPRSRSRAPRRSRPPWRAMPIRVVIAEDEAIIRLDLKETLEEEGYEVVGQTGRGDEAVELVKELSPDLAILDVKMPGMDGLEAAAQISADKQAAVLILTAFSQRDLIEKARDAGALAYLVKPFQKSELIPAVEVAL